MVGAFRDNTSTLGIVVSGVNFRSMGAERLSTEKRGAQIRAGEMNRESGKVRALPVVKAGRNRAFPDGTTLAFRSAKWFI